MVAQFPKAVFKQKASFNSDQIEAYAEFRTATFKGDADFIGARIGSNAQFDQAKFEQRAIFDSAQIKGHALFNLATFEQEANFAVARIGSAARFDGATFRNQAIFQASEFAMETSFRGDSICQRRQLSEHLLQNCLFWRTRDPVPGKD